MSGTLWVAIGGLLLGIINTGILVYKEFFKKEKLKTDSFIVLCESAFMHRIREGLHDVQINVSIASQYAINTIKEIKLVHNNEVFGSGGRSSNSIVLNMGYIIFEKNLLSLLLPDKFVEKVRKLNEDSSEVVYLHNRNFQAGEGLTLSFLARLEGFRQMDGWDDLPYTGWSIELINSKGEVFTTSFDFTEITDFYRGRGVL